MSISIYAPNETGRVTGVSSYRNGYVVAGDQSRLAGVEPGANLTRGRYWVSGIEVPAPASSGVIVVAADGNMEIESDGGRSWPDFLALRLQNNNATKALGVVLTGGAYTLLADSFSFSNIVASQNGVRYLMLCPSSPTLLSFGLNTRGPSPEAQITQKLSLTIEEARKHGISIIGCTLPPQQVRVAVSKDGDAEFRDEKGQMRKIDSVRVAVNEWMKSSGAFDGLVDLDAITRDPANPGTLKQELRIPNDPPVNVLNDRAHQVIADAIDLSLFTR